MNTPGFTAEMSLTRVQSRRSAWDPSETLAVVSPALPCIHGNWCAPDCTAPCSSGPEPIDDVDTCCKEHDCCYEFRGYFACSCERKLLACLDQKRSWSSGKGRAAIAMYEWFYRQPCIWWR
jgi:hypothetical protein